MILSYDPLTGVPPNHYYLVEILQFSDFEVPHKEHVIFVCKDKQPLIDMCIQNKWYSEYYSPHGHGWHTHYIKYREA